MTDIIIAEDDFDIQSEMQSQNWARRIAECLERKYPGYMWAVHADARNNIAYIKSMAISGEYGYNLHLDKIDAHNKRIIHAGGEILERHKLERSRMNEATLTGKVRDSRGNILGDWS
jgi:hypothetical protein